MNHTNCPRRSSVPVLLMPTSTDLYVRIADTEVAPAQLQHRQGHEQVPRRHRMATSEASYLLPADQEGTVDFDGLQTWYRITGQLDSDQVPLVVVHGGPGCTHD